jgi:hypothetical protein
MMPFWSILMKISESQPSNTLLRKYLVKWWTRLGSAHLPPRIANWRYQRGRRSLKENLLQSTSNGMQNKSPTEDNTGSASCQEQDFFLVPDQVEEAMGQVIGALTDPSTIVRWSAAKGVGRLTERLPLICAEDVVDALLDLFGDMEKDNDWHGGCLALAELARRGLLLPSHLDGVIPKIVEAIHVSAAWLLNSQVSSNSHSSLIAVLCV